MHAHAEPQNEWKRHLPQRDVNEVAAEEREEAAKKGPRGWIRQSGAWHEVESQQLVAQGALESVAAVVAAEATPPPLPPLHALPRRPVRATAVEQ